MYVWCGSTLHIYYKHHTTPLTWTTVSRTKRDGVCLLKPCRCSTTKVE